MIQNVYLKGDRISFTENIVEKEKKKNASNDKF